MPFDPAKRLIYEYYDGTLDQQGKYRKRFGDPIAMHQNLMEMGGGEGPFNKLWEKVFLAPLAARADREMLAKIVAQAFDLKLADPYDPGGWNETEVFTILDDFAAWQKKRLSNTDGSPNISPPTQESPSPSAVSITRHMSASGSTATGPEPFPQL